MTRILSTSVYLILAMLGNLQAQKHDYNWLNGYGDFTQTEYNRNGLLLNFAGTEVKATVFEKDQWFFLTSLAYSDAEGNFQMYSDGCALYDEDGVMFENGDSLHDDSFCDSNLGYPADQGMLALPTSDEQIVSIFYNEEYFSSDTLGINGSRIRVRLLRALVDIDENVVLSKNEEVLDTLASNILSATKHANGQDWWLLNQDYFSNEYYSLLVREGEVIDTVSSFIGNQVLAPGSPQSNFSPDGKLFARYDVLDNLELYDFDRATGRLSNFRHIEVPNTLELPHSGGLSFSGSSRFLYVNDAIGIWQYDMEASDIAASVVQVAEREEFATGLDIFNSPTYTFFYRMALAPDCRIYMSARSGTDRIYVIMDPEQKGVACDVVQNIKIPVWNDNTIAHYPNYRLDTAPFCDSSKDFPSNLMTTTVSTSSAASSAPQRIHAYPNPAQDFVRVYLKNVDSRAVRFELYDLLGRSVLARDVSVINGEALEQISLSQVPSGIYVYSVHREGQVLYTDRLVVERR